jgi:hypothetical protein
LHLTVSSFQTHLVYGVAVRSAQPLSASIPRVETPPDVRFDVRHASPAPSFWTTARALHVDASCAAGPPDAIFVSDSHPEIAVIRFANAADFYVAERSITCHLKDPTRRRAVEAWLLGPVMALWLERASVLALQGAGVQINDGGLALLADEGAGRSLLTAVLLNRGHTFLADDVLAVNALASPPSVRSAVPHLHLTPDDAARYAGSLNAPCVAPGTQQRRVAVGTDGFGRYTPRSVPLTAILIPCRRSDVSSVSLRRLSPAQTLMCCINHSWFSHACQALANDRSRQEAIAHLVRVVPAYTLTYPDGREHLPEVAETLERHAFPASRRFV